MILGTGLQDQPLAHRFEREPGFPWWTLGALLRGATLFETRGRRLVVRERALILVRPRTPYRIEFAGEGRAWSEAWAIFAPRPDWAPLMEWPEPLPGLLTLDASSGHAAEAVDAAIAAHRAFVGAGRERARFAENLLERAFLLAHLANERDGGGRHPAVRAALDAIATRWREPLDVGALARAAGCSPSHLAHLFSEQMGASPMAWLEEQRIERAKGLLAGTTLPIRLVAAEVGFANPFHFATRFRRRVGVAPSAYRRRPG